MLSQTARTPQKCMKMDSPGFYPSFYIVVETLKKGRGKLEGLNIVRFFFWAILQFETGIGNI